MSINRMLLEIFVCSLLANLMYSFEYYLESKWPKNCLRLFFNKTPPMLITHDDYQLYHNKCMCENYRGDYYVASYYDTRKKVPHFSAYTMPHNQVHPEPTSDQRYWRKGKGLETNQQPMLKDYIGVGNKYLDRGHLAPRFYFPTQNGRRATDVLTNIALQYNKFNQHTWYSLEKSIFSASKMRCIGDSYFITGVIPSETSFYESKYSSTKINIPNYFWTAVCCDTSKMEIVSDRFEGWSFAYIAENVNSSINKVDLLTVDEFIKDERIRQQYYQPEFFKTILVKTELWGFKIVKNCLFNSDNAEEIINEIKEANQVKGIVKIQKHIPLFNLGFEDPGDMIGNMPLRLSWFFKSRR